MGVYDSAEARTKAQKNYSSQSNTVSLYGGFTFHNSLNNHHRKVQKTPFAASAAAASLNAATSSTSSTSAAAPSLPPPTPPKTPANTIDGSEVFNIKLPGVETTPEPPVQIVRTFLGECLFVQLIFNLIALCARFLGFQKNGNYSALCRT